MERADQSVITQGILCHILKYLRRLKVLALPKQCNDSVIAVVGQNCPNLESIVLNDTGVTNTGMFISTKFSKEDLITVHLRRNRLVTVLPTPPHGHHVENGSQSTWSRSATSRPAFFKRFALRQYSRYFVVLLRQRSRFSQVCAQNSRIRSNGPPDSWAFGIAVANVSRRRVALAQQCVHLQRPNAGLFA